MVRSIHWITGPRRSTVASGWVAAIRRSPRAAPAPHGSRPGRRSRPPAARLGDELRQEGHIEDADLGVEQVAHHALEKPVGHRPGLFAGSRKGLARAQQHVQPRVSQAGRAAVFQQVVGQLRDRNQGPEPECHRSAPQQAACVDAQGGAHGLGAALHRGCTQNQCGVQARREGQHRGGEGEGDQVVDDGHGARPVQVQVGTLAGQSAPAQPRHRTRSNFSALRLAPPLQRIETKRTALFQA